MAPTRKHMINSFRWATATGVSCGLSWLALYTVVRLFGTQDPTAPPVVSIAAPAIILLAIWIISAIKQAATSEGEIWTWIMVYRKFVTGMLVIALAAVVVLAAVAVDESLVAGVARMLIGIAVILAVVGAILGGLLANFDFSQLRNFR